MQVASRISSWASGGGDEPTYWGLYFEAEEAGAVVNMVKNGSPTAVTLETSTDGTNWTMFDAEGGTTPITLAHVGDRVYFRAGTVGNTQFGRSTSVYHKFTLSKKAGAHGNIMSILADDSSAMTIGTTYAFIQLFNGCDNLTTAPDLPATTLSQFCYQNMFRGCTSLTDAPSLPALNAVRYCYSGMFNGCSSLSVAPELPATTLGDNCYAGMFSGCTLLTTAPALLAMTLAKSCYYEMFYGCTSLTVAPVIEATTVASSSCYSMFSGCTSLVSASVPPALTMQTSCYRRMFDRCSSLSVTMTLPATTLANFCYYEMFQSCGALTTVNLPAATLVSNCYGWMFAYSSLSNLTVGFTSWDPSDATSAWLVQVMGNGTFVCPAALGTNETITRGTSNCPTGWNVVNT